MAVAVLCCSLFEMLISLFFFGYKFISLPCRKCARRSAVLVNRQLSHLKHHDIDGTV